MDPYDDEELINDYIEEDYQGPPDYDEELIEEMMLGQTSQAATRAFTAASSSSPARRQDADNVDSQQSKNIHDETTFEPITVQEYMSKQNPQENLYKFERQVFL